jgi:hypothetical protein
MLLALCANTLKLPSKVLELSLQVRCACRCPREREFRHASGFVGCFGLLLQLQERFFRTLLTYHEALFTLVCDLSSDQLLPSQALQFTNTTLELAELMLGMNLPICEGLLPLTADPGITNV